ncbi:MAG TPA: cupin-like domain-containing protein [Povalibacter sp.]|nr:cupin-like domain-containing protein [Povalibacter sp.]
MQPIRNCAEWHNVDASRFRDEVAPRNEPAVLRGVAAHWPLVRAALQSSRAAAEYIRPYDQGKLVETFRGSPDIGGRFFYRADMQGINFERQQQPLSSLIDDLLIESTSERPRAMYAGAVPASQLSPQFASENTLGLLPPSVMPRIWIGNANTIPAHFDMSANIACVAAGRRRFTVFPPEQLVNLYVGPLDFTLAGQPSSLVDIESPDLVRHPRFATALEHAQSAELGPGDAIYIPELWWHHVKSLDTFNVLVNYWWNDSPTWAGSPFEGMIHALLAIRDQPPATREAWRAFFDHYVFLTGEDPAAHLPPESRGVLGTITPEMATRMRLFLVQGLQMHLKPKY